MELELSLRKSFPGLTLNIEQNLSGDGVGIFGPSGSGKSTLAALISGMEEPDEGKIILDGEPLFDSSRKINTPPERRRIGIVFQHSHLFPHMNVLSNLLYGHRRTPAILRRIEPDSVIGELGLGELLSRSVSNLSGGEKQRVALGRALLTSPRLLIMDEPLSALDDNLRFRIIPYLKSVSERFSIPFLFISHSLMEMRLMIREVMVMDRGSASIPMAAEELARQRMGESQVGFINILRLSNPETCGNLLCYDWGGTFLQLTGKHEGGGEAIYELSSRDIILCRQHPEAISARNLLPGKVVRMFESGGKAGVEIAFNGNQLVAEIVRDAARELAIEPGAPLYAVIKASAFRRLV